MKQSRRTLDSNIITPPQSQLIHHFPLAFNGNLDDDVGNAILTPTTGRFYWEASANRYRGYSGRNIKSAIITGVNLSNLVVGQLPKNVSIACKAQAVTVTSNWVTVIAMDCGVSMNIDVSVVNPNIVIKTGVEYQMCVVVDANSVRKIYFDGVLISTTPLTTNVANKDVYIQFSTWSAGNGNIYIRDLKIFNKALTLEEINDL